LDFICFFEWTSENCPRFFAPTAVPVGPELQKLETVPGFSGRLVAAPRVSYGAIATEYDLKSDGNLASGRPDHLSEIPGVDANKPGSTKRWAAD
jgi:hypothetical protein